MSKLRVGVIGAGGIATYAHIPGYKKAAEAGKVELVALADINLERAQSVAAEHGFARAYGDYKEMLAKERLDAVSITTPNLYHAPAAIAALEAGCHVLCEKPPAMNPAEVEAMIAAAQAAGKICTVGLNYRFHPEVEMAKRFIDGGALGEIYAARVKVTRRRGIPSWGVFTNKALQGGGALIDVGVHMLDTALYLMGYAAPVQIMGSTYQKIGNRPGINPWGQWDWEHYEVEDLALGMVRLASGATVMVEASFADNIEKGETTVQLSGTRGGLQLLPLKVFREEYGTLTDTTPHWVPQQDMYQEEIRHFVACCLGEEEPRVKMDEMLNLQQIINGIYASAEAAQAGR
jgi:predicted dehydrogenase